MTGPAAAEAPSTATGRSMKGANSDATAQQGGAGSGGSRGIGAAIAERLAATYFVEVLAKELGPRRITVNSAVPGATTGAGVFTEATGGGPTVRVLTGRTPLGRLDTPQEVARVVAFVASDDPGFITGHHLTADGGASIR